MFVASVVDGCQVEIQEVRNMEVMPVRFFVDMKAPRRGKQKQTKNRSVDDDVRKIQLHLIPLLGRLLGLLCNPPRSISSEAFEVAQTSITPNRHGDVETLCYRIIAPDDMVFASPYDCFQLVMLLQLKGKWSDKPLRDIIGRLNPNVYLDHGCSGWMLKYSCKAPIIYAEETLMTTSASVLFSSCLQSAEMMSLSHTAKVAIIIDVEINDWVDDDECREVGVVVNDQVDRIVQIAWKSLRVSASKAIETIRSESFLIRPNGFTISTKAENVHGISTIRALTEGCDIAYVLKDIFLKMLQDLRPEQPLLLVAHNLDFDKRIINKELSLLSRELPGTPSKLDDFFSQEMDTMDPVFLKIVDPRSHGTRRFGATLMETFKCVVTRDCNREELLSAHRPHDAASDVNICAAIFTSLLLRGLLLL